MNGPYPIICRGHSGSRLLAEAFLRNGFWMGLSDNPRRDSKEFRRKRSSTRKLVLASHSYRGLPEDERRSLQDTMRQLVQHSKERCPNPDDRVAYGWKRGFMAFTTEILLDACPQAKVVHLIRDGRDVMLSTLKAVSEMHDPVARVMVFGDADVAEYDGEPLALELVEARRVELEMLHWVTATSFAMRGRDYPGRYFEVRYEDLCGSPVQTLTSIFNFLDVPLLPETRDWIAGAASTKRIGKWRDVETHDGANAAIAIGEPLLRELGYW